MIHHKRKRRHSVARVTEASTIGLLQFSPTGTTSSPNGKVSKTELEYIAQHFIEFPFLTLLIVLNRPLRRSINDGDLDTLLSRFGTKRNNPDQGGDAEAGEEDRKVVDSKDAEMSEVHHEETRELRHEVGHSQDKIIST